MQLVGEEEIAPGLRILIWSSLRWLDISTVSACDVREWTLRVGKESCWEGIDRDASSRMSSGVTRWRLSAALVSRPAR